MTDEQLLEEIRLGMGYLLAHGRLRQCDAIREVCARYANVDRLVVAARAMLDAEDGTICPFTCRELEEALAPFERRDG